jgi:HEAT repeat protein
MLDRVRAWFLIANLAEGSIRENSDTVDKLRAIGAPAVGPLVRGLGKRKYSVKLECIRALGYIADPRAVPHLEKLLAHPNDVVREFARTALDRIQNKNSAPHQASTG